jgi:carboxyl-terminal processing protease
MNGLSTIINVVSIGDTTNGKPSGMNGWSVGEKYYFWPVTFMLMNSKNEGDFFDGIEPSKLVTDDITRDFNDRNEYCLKEAIHFLETGSVSTKGSGEYMRGKYKRNPTFFEKPSWREKGLLIGDDL